MCTVYSQQVDIHIMTQPPNVEWTYYGTEVTDSNGRVTFTIPKESQLPQGMYPVKVSLSQPSVANNALVNMLMK